MVCVRVRVGAEIPGGVPAKVRLRVYWLEPQPSGQVMAPVLPLRGWDYKSVHSTCTGSSRARVQDRVVSTPAAATVPRIVTPSLPTCSEPGAATYLLPWRRLQRRRYLCSVGGTRRGGEGRTDSDGCGRANHGQPVPSQRAADRCRTRRVMRHTRSGRQLPATYLTARVNTPQGVWYCHRAPIYTADCGSRRRLGCAGWLEQLRRHERQDPGRRDNRDGQASVRGCLSPGLFVTRCRYRHRHSLRVRGAELVRQIHDSRIVKLCTSECRVGSY